MTKESSGEVEDEVAMEQAFFAPGQEIGIPDSVSGLRASECLTFLLAWPDLKGNIRKMSKECLYY